MTEKKYLTEEEIVHVEGLHSRWVRLPDGRRAHYMTSGETGPAIVLLHGGLEGSSGTAGWRFMAPFLGANGFRVYCPDIPGFGLSDTSRPEYVDRSPKGILDYLKMFVDTLALDQFHLGGNSLGCMNAVNFIINHPERVLSVSVIAGSFGDIAPMNLIPPSEGKFLNNPDCEFVPFDGSEESMRNLMDSIIYEPSAVWPELVTMRTNSANKQRAAREAFGLPPATFAPYEDPNMLQIFTTANRFDKLTIPMIYLYGLQDVMLPVELGFRQEETVPNVQFFYPDHCGHQGQTDQPELFNQVFLEFFRDGRVCWETALKAGVSRRRPIDNTLVEEPPEGFPSLIPEAYTDIDTLREALTTAN